MARAPASAGGGAVGGAGFNDPALRQCLADHGVALPQPGAGTATVGATVVRLGQPPPGDAGLPGPARPDHHQRPGDRLTAVSVPFWAVVLGVVLVSGRQRQRAIG